METEAANNLALAGNNFIHAVQLVNAISCGEFNGMAAADVNGENWFDSRLELISKIA